ncbi:kinase-like protein, partial [Backusella circina FSU 941]
MSSTFASIEKKHVGNSLYTAVKKYSKNHGNIVIRHCKRELWALRELNVTSFDSCLEQHIIQLIEYKEVGVYCCLTLPFFCNTLADKLSTNTNPALAHDLLEQISKGLEFIHGKNIVHCDLSPANILMDEVGHMIISDFGCAHSIVDDNQHDDNSDNNEVDEIGTRLYYKAPEHLFGSKKYAPSTDVWSLGVIFCQILIGYPIFAGESDIEQIGIIVRSLGKPSAQTEDEEMSKYPDTNKLSFFSCPSNDEDDEDD